MGDINKNWPNYLFILVEKKYLYRIILNNIEIDQERKEFYKHSYL